MAGLKDLPVDTRLNDELFYTAIEVHFESYPRIKHFQTELRDLFSRFLGLYEQLPWCLKLSGDMLKSLKDAVHLLTNCNPKLFLFGPTHSKISKVDLIKKYKVSRHNTHSLEDIHVVDDKDKNHKLVVAICILRMMNTKKGRDTLLKVRDCFGFDNMIFFVDEDPEVNNDMVVNNLRGLENLLKLNKESINAVYQNKMEISNAISNHMEHKFLDAFKSLNIFLLEITKKRSHTHGSIIRAKDTGGRLYKEITRFFEHPLTVIDILITSKGGSAEQKLAKAIVCFAKTILIREIARTYEIQDAKVFDYLQEENFENNCIEHLEKHLSTVPLVTKFYKVIQNPNDELVKDVILTHYTLNDAKTIGKEVTKVLIGYFIQVGTSVKYIRIMLDLLIMLRKELLRLMEDTIGWEKYDKGIPKIEKWRTQLVRIKEVESLGCVFGKLCVCLKMPEHADRETEVRLQIRKLLRDYPGEVVIEIISYASFAGRQGPANNSEIAMGDAFVTNTGCRGTIGLFMYEDGNESTGLHFVTSSHIVLGSDIVRTNDDRPVRLGKKRHDLVTEDGLLDIAAIQIENNVQNRCNVFFQENGQTCESIILDIDGIMGLKEGQHVYKRGSASGETKGCIISEDFRRLGLQNHNFLVGMPANHDLYPPQGAFAIEGDSGAALYTKTPDGKVRYLAIIMGEFSLRETEDSSNLGFKDIIRRVGSPILTTCLRVGLNKIEQKFGIQLTLPTI